MQAPQNPAILGRFLCFSTGIPRYPIDSMTMIWAMMTRKNMQRG